MANQISNGNTATTEPPDLKRKLALRMTFAGLMIVALLATLAVFDRLSAPDEPEVQTPRFTEPVPVPKKKSRSLSSRQSRRQRWPRMSRNRQSRRTALSRSTSRSRLWKRLRAPRFWRSPCCHALPRPGDRHKQLRRRQQHHKLAPSEHRRPLRRPSRSHLHRCASRCFLPGRRRRRGFFRIRAAGRRLLRFTSRRRVARKINAQRYSLHTGNTCSGRAVQES